MRRLVVASLIVLALLPLPRAGATMPPPLLRLSGEWEAEGTACVAPAPPWVLAMGC